MTYPPPPVRRAFAIVRRSLGPILPAWGLVACAATAPTAKAEAPPAGAPSPPAVDALALEVAACHERASGLGAWLAEVDGLGWSLGSSLLDGGARLVARSGVALEEPAPVVHLRASEQAIDGMRLADLASLGERLTAQLDVRRRTMEGSPFIANPRVYFAIDADVPWSRVVAASERVVASGFERVDFVFFDATRNVPAIPESPLGDDLAKLAQASPSKRGQIVAESLAFVYKECPSALQLIAQFGHEVPEVNQALVEQLPGAVEACRCAVDDAAVRSLHWALYGNPKPGSSVPLSFASSAATARVLTADAETPWEDASELVVELSRMPNTSVSFAVAPSNVRPANAPAAAQPAARGPRR